MLDNAFILGGRPRGSRFNNPPNFGGNLGRDNQREMSAFIVLTEDEELMIEGRYQEFIDKGFQSGDSYMSCGDDETIYNVEFDLKKLNTCTLTPIMG